MRRFTRLTNGFSKKLENHEAAVSLGVCFYSFCRVHETIRCTPGMELGVTDHIWTIGELVAEALKGEEVSEPEPPKPIYRMRPGHKPLKLRVIRGEKLTRPR